MEKVQAIMSGVLLVRKLGLTIIHLGLAMSL